MLLLVPFMVFLLKEVGDGSDSIMTVGVYIPGSDESSAALKGELNLGENKTDTNNVSYIEYPSADQLVDDVAAGKVTEGWIVPENLDGLVETIAENQVPDDKIQIVIRESGLSHILGKEIACSKVYPSVAKKVFMNYMAAFYGGDISAEKISQLEKTYNSFGLSKSLFQMSYFEEAEGENASIILMPLRGILALWLMLCGLATSMYYLEDERNGLFLWWRTPFAVARDIGYYATALAAPTVVVVLSLIYSGSFTTFSREVPALLIYELAVILFSMALREIFGSIKNLGVITPVLLVVSAILSPVFIDIKEARAIEKCCPVFHYLSSIHDFYYIKTLLIYAVFLWCLVVLLLKLPVKVGKVFKANLL
jgi:ABC-2 type transport system permease protein